MCHTINNINKYLLQYKAGREEREREKKKGMIGGV
jgi:hypothetical protein